MSDLLLANIIANVLVEEAEKTIGIHEEGGENRGRDVEIFQRTVDGRANREPWCMSWLQTIVERARTRLGANSLPLPRSELCKAVWNGCPLEYRRDYPAWGYAVIWANHCGLVTLSYKRSFNTVEGNTSASGSNEGDAVHRKVRSRQGGKGPFQLLGFVDLPAMIRDSIPDQNVKKST